jgi:hypothetical protein
VLGVSKKQAKRLEKDYRAYLAAVEEAVEASDGSEA